MQAHRVDPRDVAMHVCSPVFRVYFVDQVGSSDEWRLENASWESLLSWVEANKGERIATIWLEADVQCSPGLYKILEIG